MDINNQEFEKFIITLGVLILSCSIVGGAVIIGVQKLWRKIRGK